MIRRETFLSAVGMCRSVLESLVIDAKQASEVARANE